jgi:hypothetical protein
VEIPGTSCRHPDRRREWPAEQIGYENLRKRQIADVSHSRRRIVFTRSSSARMRHNAGGVQQQARSSRVSTFNLRREFDAGSRKPRCAGYS